MCVIRFSYVGGSRHDGVSDPDARSIPRVVSAWLSTRNALLVVDNCEHLIDACAELVQEFLASAASLNVIATSREPLGVPGEVQLRVPPLEPMTRCAFSRSAPLPEAGLRTGRDRAGRPPRCRATRWHAVGNRAGRGAREHDDS